MALRTLALLAALAVAWASCPNDCSGHGYCNAYSACNCFRNWQGADCSMQSCAWSHSFVDIPQGDLNADGRLDIPDIYTVTLCSKASMVETAADTPLTADQYWRSFNGDQHTDISAAAAIATGYTKIAIHDTDTSAWNTGLYILENIYAADQFTESNDPLGVVERCMERESDLTFGLLVHVRADSDPGLICDPNEWLLDNHDSATVRFTHCVDDTPTSSSARNQPDLLRMATLDPYQNDGTDITAFGGNAAKTVYVGSWSAMTYVNQATNDKLWERYPDDHFHAGQRAGINNGDLYVGVCYSEAAPGTQDAAVDTDVTATSGCGATTDLDCSVQANCEATLNHWYYKSYPSQDNEADAATTFAKGDWDEGHFYAECSAKGLCDRGTGLCQCFPGFTGDGCARTACPDDCSGHGTCQRLVDVDDRYLAWDAYKTQSCKCDPGYTGPNCALRICPKGDDPVTRLSTSSLQQYTGGNGVQAGGLDHTGHRTQSAEIQVIGVSSYDDLLTGDDLAATGGGGDVSGVAPFALEFTDEMGDKWTTQTVNFRKDTPRTAANVAADIEAALEALPNNVVPNVEVNDQGIKLPKGCAVVAGVAGSPDVLTCTNYGAAIPSAAWLVAQEIVGTFTNGVCTSDADTLCLVVTNGKLTEARTGGTDLAASTIDFTTGFTDGSSLYAITFVENSGDIPDLGARFQWEFDVAAVPADEKDCSAATFETVVGSCVYSQSTSVGAFDAESVANSFYMQELFKGDKEEVVCSNRGICDYSTGLCKCFNGFTMHDCSVQNSLATA